MYLVELRPGKEELYRTGDELAAAIRSGDVDMHSRIYHRATSKWISVTLHPQYKAIVAERPAAPPLPPLERSTWTFFNDSADALAGANDGTMPQKIDLKEGDDTDPNWRRPLALSVTGGLLILGLQLAAAGPRPPWAARDAQSMSPAAIRPASIAAPLGASATVSLASTTTRWPNEDGYAPSTAGYAASAKPSAADSMPPVVAPAPVIPAAPRLRAKVLLKDVLPTRSATRPTATGKPTVSFILQSWSAAHDSAQARLASGIRVARLNQLFATSRLSPAGGVTETRMSLAGVANFVRVYRQQQATIDREYQDSFAVVSKRQGWSAETVRDWYSKPARQESASLAALTTSLIDGIDSLLGVLDAQAGTYVVTKNTIKFEDPGAARAYASLRERITATVDSARAAGSADHSGPMFMLLQAIGTTRLPVAT
ncbi:MAG TPA: hypothetical protein VMY76_09345 [Gemmatimonadales bacterium]|nr:hypothetical protein [Gemmatimonadales bacterium]